MLLVAAVALLYAADAAADAAGLYGLPWSWLWGPGALSTAIIIPLWLLLPRRWPVISGARPLTAAACALLVLAPFAVRGAVSPGPATAPGPGWWGCLASLAVAALAEEVQFRGFLLDLLSPRGGGAFPVVAGALLFAGVHIDNPSAGPAGVANILLFGLLLGSLRIRGAGLPALWALHLAWNAMTGPLFGWRVSGIELPSVFDPPGMPFGEFGPESSLMLTVCLAAAAAALPAIDRMVRRRREGEPA